MKVTALIPDDLVSEVKEMAAGKNLSESLILALKEWTSIQKLRNLRGSIRKRPLEFSDTFSALKIRTINRSR